MTIDKIPVKDLRTLQNEKGNICVSIVIPCHRLSPERRIDRLEAKKSIEKAGQLLHHKYSEKGTEPLLKTMDELFETIDFTHQLDGIGLYVSSNVNLLVRYPFPVEEKVIAERNFGIRDLLYWINYSEPYYVLMLTKNGVRFFEGEWEDLNEVKDGHFPKEYMEEYIYNPPSRGTSYSGNSQVQNFERDKSVLEEIRFKDFFRHVDELLNGQLAANKPLILLGTEKEQSWFEKISAHKKNIIAKLSGSYNYSNEKQLGDIAWPLMLSHLQDQRRQLVKEFQEKIGQGLGITGIQDIWSAVQEGKAFKLLVEKDYKSPGFLTENEYHLYIRPPKKRHKVLSDAVDDIIENVMEKNGHVFFVDNGILKDYNRMALITRY